MKLGEYKQVLVIWVSDHGGTEGNQITDQLARTGSEHPFIEPDPAYGMSETSCQAVHEMLWEQTPTQQTGSPHRDKNMQKVSFRDPSQERLETVIRKQDSTETCHGTTHIYHHLKGTPVHTGTAKQYHLRKLPYHR
jgi:hypothetical protein